MITLDFFIRYPIRFQKEDFKNYGCSTSPLSENKSWEIQFTRYTYNIFGISLNLHWKGHDHAGPEIEITLFGYTLAAKIYDHRHWDNQKKDWVCCAPNE